ncbi:hypothetical protein AKO1_008840 [Acrasis kona]|uniref:Uncharacterized protein n=1 Tax=Acrasis kona TaxID=1008807 RepID=A0AAW2ZH54_9EUKA
MHIPVKLEPLKINECLKNHEHTNPSTKFDLYGGKNHCQYEFPDRVILDAMREFEELIDDHVEGTEASGEIKLPGAKKGQSLDDMMKMIEEMAQNDRETGANNFPTAQASTTNILRRGALEERLKWTMEQNRQNGYDSSFLLEENSPTSLNKKKVYLRASEQRYTAMMLREELRIQKLRESKLSRLHKKLTKNKEIRDGAYYVRKPSRIGGGNWLPLDGSSSNSPVVELDFDDNDDDFLEELILNNFEMGTRKFAVPLRPYESKSKYMSPEDF